MSLPTLATDCRDKARKCRLLAESADGQLAKQLFFLADEYEAVAYTLERSGAPASSTQAP